jgi:sigma-B regulation protein RsbU (phosphoserine phosphatase)
VRAGHDPAIVYDPGSDSFDPLEGRGLALGVDGEWIYEDNKKFSFSFSSTFTLGHLTFCPPFFESKKVSRYTN